MTTSSRRPTPAGRATRRSRRPAPRSATFLERNRSRLLWATAGLATVLLVGLAYVGFTRPAYACLNEFNPSPAPSVVVPTTDPAATPLPSGAAPAPVVTPRPPGYAQPDMGHQHAPVGETITYRYCPPASGRHYNASGQGPIPPGLYGPDDPGAIPPGWVHNLEHGAIVLLYKCPGPGCEESGQQALEELLARWPASPVCNVPPNTRETPVIARFDQMASNFMAIVWDVVLPMDQIDEGLLFEFYAGQAERLNPEKLCAPPTPTPGPATPAPTGTPGTSPGASPAASPASSPAATTGPSPS